MLLFNPIFFSCAVSDLHRTLAVNTFDPLLEFIL